MAGSIGRRVNSALTELIRKDYESSLIHYFPALDNTASKRYPNLGVGDRIREFIKKEEALISFLAVGEIISGNLVNGVTFPQAMYKFGRTYIMHEGELSERIKINEKGWLFIGHDIWELPYQYLWGMCFAVILAEENKDEKAENNLTITIHSHEFELNSLWGKRNETLEFLADKLNFHAIRSI
ncbi:hypothetical protein [Serratia liquefaciens]|uniref:hypothetical protein n=1 Tax=Serratia liquefaciens TaxID=614 RepID=UPI00301BC619